MRFTNATTTSLRVVEYDIEADEFTARAEVAPGQSVLLAYVDTAQIEVHGDEHQQYLVLTKIAGVPQAAVQSGGGGVIHDPENGEPPFDI